ncbi:uncharacterized protein PV07_10496 [Cladophialophora immunda]|uniref:Protein kinase domain-containing protein n=1 Tax=Cladophialophora immunda TaxID=569365 RepID=A0A0D2C2T1_9EURO|nr:uncharacterized protein PV07_10496 [Cladophialophora immunda]KIW24805.1 hypothetical protein PV07_10496 [Cladophialophora immunda]
MASIDRRGTRFIFDRKRFRSEDEGDDDGEEGGIDQADMIASKWVNSPTKPDRASIQSTPNSHSPRNLTKIRTRHGSIEIGKLPLPQSQDPWKKFKPLLHVRQGCPAIMARSIPPDQQLYAVRSVTSAEKDKHLRAIQQLGLCPGRGIDRVQETFDWSGTLFVVTQYVKPSLSQIITSQDRPTEAHIAFIAYEKILISLVLLEEQGLVHGSLDSSFVLIPPSCVPILGKY